MNTLKKMILLAGVMLMSTTIHAQTEKQAAPADGMFIRGNQVFYIKAGVVNKLPAGDQDLVGGGKINAFGKMTMADGSVHQLAPGELVDFSGKIAATKVEEYVTVQNGIAVIMTNGIASPIDVGFKFADDKQIDAYGTISDGQTLKAGQKMDMNGQLMK
jgi:hypothetical protein